MEIVALKNRQSGMVLDHYAGKRIEAYNNNVSNRHRQWRRTACRDTTCVTFTNVGTGEMLAHYAGQRVQTRAGRVDENCMWEELCVDAVGFRALRNRATGMLLDHYREQSVQAYSGEDDRISQHWQLLNLRSPACRGFNDGDSQCAVLEVDTYDIVAFRNLKTGMVLDHYAGDRLEAYTSDLSNRNHQWYRIPVGDGCFAYKNVATGKVLENYYGESVQAFSTLTHLPSHQWREVDAGDGSVLLLNCMSAKALDHCHELSIQACSSIAIGATMQWKLVWVRRAA